MNIQTVKAANELLQWFKDRGANYIHTQEGALKIANSLESEYLRGRQEKKATQRRKKLS